MSDEMNKSNQLVELLQQDDSIYYAEDPREASRDPAVEEPISETVVQKSGYLNLRSYILYKT
jgi:hypothetical protein